MEIITRRQQPAVVQGLVFRVLVGLGCVLASLLGVAAQPASALTVHPFLTTSIGTDGKPIAYDGEGKVTSGNNFAQDVNVAFDQAGQRLYIASGAGVFAEGKVYGYDVSVPGVYTPLGGNFPLTVPTGQIVDIAVDNTQTPSATAGNVYVAGDRLNAPDFIAGWNPDGVPLGPGLGYPSFFPFIGDVDSCGGACGGWEVQGLDVDPAGKLWASQFFQAIRQFDPTGGPEPLQKVSVSGQGSFSSNNLGQAQDPAFDSNGDMYLSFAGGADAGVWKYPAATSYTTTKRIELDIAEDVEVDRSTHLVYTAHQPFQGLVAPRVDVYDANGNFFERFAGNVKTSTGTSATSFRGIAIDGSTGTVYVADGSSSSRVLVFDGIRTPEVEEPTAVTQFSVTLNARLDAAGGPEFTDCYIEYVAEDVFEDSGYADLVSPGPALAGSVPCAPGPPYPGPEDVEAELAGLEYGTIYHYRFVGEIGSGPVASLDHSFETDPAVYGVSAADATDITQTTATLRGSFNGDGSDTSYYFQWGPTTSYGNATPVSSAGEPEETVPVSATIDGLTPFQSLSDPYHYRLVVTNEIGTTYGPDHTLLTLPPLLPQIGAASASGLSPSGATLSALINPNLTDTVFAFEYGTDSSYGATTPLSGSIGADDADHPVNAVVTGLTPGTTYHFRAVALNFGGASHSADLTFTTPDRPRVDASSATAIGETTAHVSARVGAGASPTVVRFEYGTTSAYGQVTPAVQIGSDLLAREVGVDIGGLAPNTTYHFRALATNAIGSAAGGEQTFTTKVAQASPPPRRACKRGFVKRRGKCVKRPRHKHRRHRGGGRG